MTLVIDYVYNNIVDEPQEGKIMKAYKSYYDNHVVIKDKNGNFKGTRLNSYFRYIHTIKPIEELLNFLEKEAE